MSYRIRELENIVDNFDTYWEENKEGYGSLKKSEAQNKKDMKSFYTSLLETNLIIEEKGIDFLVNSWRSK